MSLDKLINKRKNHLKSCKENNDNSHDVIASLYSEASHFVYELLQNADDVKAANVNFKLTKNYLKVIHDGERKFDLPDIKSITTVGSSTKANEPNSIGTFGAGFKSVFAVTQTPQIHSGNFHIEIEDYIIPQKIKPMETRGKTIFILPFNRSDLSNEKAYEQIAERLENLKAESLLFLRHINKIKWSTEEKRGYFKSKKIESNQAKIVSSIDGQSKSKDYLLFTKRISINDTQLSLAIAFQLDRSDSPKIVPLQNTNLFVFFPTNERTRLKFLVHIPYKTTPSRESIPFEDQQNKFLTNRISELFSESILEIKKSGLLRVDFLTMLPHHSTEDHPVYKSIFDSLKKLFLKEDILPIENGSFGNASNTILANQKELVTLLNKDDCKKLFERGEWLDSNITINKTPTFRKYLLEKLDIPEINVEKFCATITEGFIHNKSDNWLIDFYSAMTNQNRLYRKNKTHKSKGILRTKPIIRLQNGEHIAVEDDDDQIQVYLPKGQKSEFKTVKWQIIENEQALEFLKNLGLQEPDDISEIKEHILPRYKKADSSVSKKQYLSDFSKSFQIWKTSDEYKKPKVIDVLNTANFIGCMVGDLFHIRKPTEVYFRSKKLLNWFEGNDQDDFYFLIEGLQGNEYREFLKKLGVNRSVSVNGSSTHKFERYAHYERGVNRFNPNFLIHGISYAIENININRSVYLWSRLLEYPNKLTGYIEKKTNKNKPYKKPENNQQSKAMVLLSSHNWLFDQDNNLIKKPLDEILMEDLSSEYKKEHTDIDQLITGLGMKLNEEKRFEKRTGKKVISQDEFELLQKLKNEKSDQESSAEWKAESNPEDAKINVDDEFVSKKNEKDLSGQTTNKKISDNNQTSRKGKKSNNSNSRDNYNKGKWGEKYAFRYLEKEYSKYNVINLNENGNTGEGYDFVVRKNENDIAYFEVKSKETKNPTSFEITRAQWNWAKTLHKKEMGDKYYILVVSNAGSKENASITPYQNPVKLWQLGEVDAVPLRIEL